MFETITLSSTPPRIGKLAGIIDGLSKADRDNLLRLIDNTAYSGATIQRTLAAEGFEIGLSAVHNFRSQRALRIRQPGRL